MSDNGQGKSRDCRSRFKIEERPEINGQISPTYKRGLFRFSLLFHLHETAIDELDRRFREPD